MGLIIYTNFVLPIIDATRELVGMKLIYIFALPYDTLIQHYQTYGFRRLNAESEAKVHNRIKPEYDKECIFMYQVM